tara:strand:+ start:48532 stop:48798 length:267 start_codon:yes stop_codon:yes gene_type:complete
VKPAFSTEFSDGSTWHRIDIEELRLRQPGFLTQTNFWLFFPSNVRSILNASANDDIFKKIKYLSRAVARTSLTNMGNGISNEVQKPLT